MPTAPTAGANCSPAPPPSGCRVSGAGVFKDAPSDAAVRRLFFEALIRPWQIVLPDFGTLEGPFQLVSLDYAGDHEGEISWDMGLESAGAIAFTAA